MAAPPVEKLKALLGGLKARALEAIPIQRKTGGGAHTPEPFSAIEDATPSSDALIEANAAMLHGFEAPKAARIDLKGLLAALSKKTVLLVALLALLVFLLALAVTAIAVGAPARALPQQKALTREGKALVGRWMFPPGPGLEPRMEMAREGKPRYSYDDAIRLGIDPAAVNRSALSAANDAAMDELYRTVR